MLQDPKIEIDAAQRGINPKTQKPYSGRTALHQALINGHIDIAEVLILKGWHLSIQDSDGQTSVDFIQDKEIRYKLMDVSNWYCAPKKLQGIFELQQLSQKITAKPCKILSLASGVAFDCKALKEMFVDAQYTGVDIDDNSNQYTLKFCKQYSDVNIITADATDLKQLKSFIGNERFDLVILRQPDIFNWPEIFSSIITKIIPAVISPEGILFVSCYYLNEMHAVRDLLLPDFDYIDKTSTLTKGKTGYEDAVIKVSDFKVMRPDAVCTLWSVSPQLKAAIKAEQLNEDSVDKEQYYSSSSRIR